MSTKAEKEATLWASLGMCLEELMTTWKKTIDHIPILNGWLQKYFNPAVGALIKEDVETLGKHLTEVIRASGLNPAATRYRLPSFLKHEAVKNGQFTESVEYYDVQKLATAMKTFLPRIVAPISGISKFRAFVDNSWLPDVKNLREDGAAVVGVLSQVQKAAKELREAADKTKAYDALVALTDLSRKFGLVFADTAKYATALANINKDAAVQSWVLIANMLHNATKAWACILNSCRCQNAELRLGNLALACKNKVRNIHCAGSSCKTLSVADYGVICPKVIAHAGDQWSDVKVISTGAAAVEAQNNVLNLSMLDKVQTELASLSSERTASASNEQSLGGGTGQFYMRALSRRAPAGARIMARPTRRNTAGQGLGRKRPATRQSVAGRQSAAGRKSAAGRQNAAGRTTTTVGQSVAASRKNALGRTRVVGIHGGQRLQGGHRSGERTSGQKRTAGRASTQAQIHGASAAGTQDVNLRRVPAQSARLLSTLARGPQGSGSGQAKTAAARTRQVGRRGISARGGNAKGISARGGNAKGISARGGNAKGISARGGNAKGISARGGNAKGGRGKM
jgi:hypothetical protein